MLLSGVLGCPNGKTIHSSKLFFEDPFDEFEVVVIDDGKVLRNVNVCHFKTANSFQTDVQVLVEAFVVVVT